MLNENIKALRKSKGLSQQDLADKLNVVRQTISKWEQDCLSRILTYSLRCRRLWKHQSARCLEKMW